MRFEICIILALFIGIGIGWLLKSNQRDPVETLTRLQPVWDGKKFHCEMETKQLKANNHE
jgi:hypothetical protein